ncbi:hypothetical protein BXZ70DRAFT_242110 [Cristinia sonorae]|uniref:Uncharacterized protein n=1 Tax=Cristinia sonorae TaxID=1940300 RepID=A0A8K0UP15_9AGAR|nr:hypothetical protein BXZ70DRAFT_242110 [Cristinia sonorae]
MKGGGGGWIWTFQISTFTSCQAMGSVHLTEPLGCFNQFSMLYYTLVIIQSIQNQTHSPISPCFPSSPPSPLPFPCTSSYSLPSISPSRLS